ncbi:N-acetylmuramoyl-L-alanine amidase [Streptomyces sp. NBC_00299]|uniref:N-acetylmuramoyl-L-alanine amidase n=1 Tax=Streptomyces sp. NBC_00299 TaxID=2975705 RepID=UPI003FA6918E
MNGVLIHHTVTSGTDSSVALCYDGYAPPPGPLCHGVIDKRGHVHMVGNGRANHAGPRRRRRLARRRQRSEAAARQRGRHRRQPPLPRCECIDLGDGRDPWPEAQKEAIEKVSAAICRHHGWSERSVIGHEGSGSRASRTRAAHDGRHGLPPRRPPAGQAGRRRRLRPPAPARVRGAPGRRFLPDRPSRPADHRHGQAPGRGGLRQVTRRARAPPADKRADGRQDSPARFTP